MSTKDYQRKSPLAIFLSYFGNHKGLFAIDLSCAMGIAAIDLTFPLIIPFFTINMVLSVKNFLMVFDQIMALTQGGPAQSTESISYLIYKNGMAGGQFGFQSANAVVFFIVIVTISVLQMRFSSKKEEQL